MKVIYFKTVILLFLSIFVISTEMKASKASKILYCKHFDISKIFSQIETYSQCTTKDQLIGSQYHKIFFYGNRILKTEVYNTNGNLETTNSYRYFVGKKVKIKSVYKDKNTKYITYKFLHVQTKQNNKRVNNFLTPYSIDAKLIMYNKKQYSLGYFKKVEKYQNNVLINISYYDVNENFEYRLRVIIFYSKQNISGYKIRRFNKDSIQEEYYDGSRRWINYFNMSERLESSFYYPEGTDRFIFSVYFYNKKKLKNDLLVKEDYYFDVDKKLLNKVYKSLLNKKLNKLKELFVQIVKGKKILLLEHNSLEIQRERWGKNIQFLKSMIVGGIENENHFRRETFWYYQKNGLIKKVEYYRDDIKNNLRKIEYYDEQGDVDRVENFNRKGEMIFDKD